MKQVVVAEFFFIVSIPTSDSSVSVNLHSLIETELCSQNDVFMAACPTCTTTVQHTQAFALGANVDSKFNFSYQPNVLVISLSVVSLRWVDVLLCHELVPWLFIL